MNLEKLREEVFKYLDEHPACTGIITDMPNRSCWNCNRGHKYLKKVEYPFTCFECGNTYYKAVNITKK